jgi:uncharacterized protein YndB with AHSA1/START domain
LEERTIVIEREFDAPRDLVWKAFIDPDEITKWWGPEHFTVPRESVEVDPRVGGVFKLTMVGPEGEGYPNEGVFTELVDGERMAFLEEDIDSPMMDSARVVIEFADAGDGRTAVTVTQTLVCTPELPELAVQGWNSQFDKLVRLFAERQS